jgi:ATP-dependent RNA helicase RhlE
VFTRTKHGADRVVRHLATAGVNAAAIHGNKSQAQRTAALLAFRKGSTPVLVATDIAARGIDVSGVSHVFNFEMPNVPEQYVHRIGRTARAGATASRSASSLPTKSPTPDRREADACATSKPAEMIQDARRDERDARGRGGAGAGAKRGGNSGRNGNRAPGGQGRDGRSRDAHLRIDRDAAAPRSTWAPAISPDERGDRTERTERTGDRRPAAGQPPRRDARSAPRGEGRPVRQGEGGQPRRSEPRGDGSRAPQRGGGDRRSFSGRGGGQGR